MTRLLALPAALLVAGCGGGSGASVDADPTRPDATVTDGAAPVPDAAPRFTLGVTVTGTGAVTSTPAGIDCPGACSQAYAEGTRVTLLAVPGAGQQFDGWGGACAGTGPCTVTLAADASASAAFSAGAAPDCANGGVLLDTGGTSGFGRQYVAAAGIANFAPIDLAFLPGSTTAFLAISQGGHVHYFDGGCTPVNTVDVRSAASGGIGVISGGEQGLLNIELHPDFAANRLVFFYHTTQASSTNSVSRMTADLGGGMLTLSDPVRIVDFQKAGGASNHNGGGLAFAPDGTLLASVGDGGSSSASAQNDVMLLGKVVRVVPSLAAGTGAYTIPAGNLFPATNAPCSGMAMGGAPCPEILAKGLRNPFRMSVDGDVVYLGDVGSGTEEVNSFTYATTPNFGWPMHDGPVASSSLPGYKNPIVAYRRSVEADAFRMEDPMATETGSASVMIGDVYRGSRYGGMLASSLFFAEFYDGFVRAVGVDASGAITDTDGVPGAHLFHENAAASFVEGPDGYVYITALYDPPMVYRLVRP